MEKLHYSTCGLAFQPSEHVSGLDRVMETISKISFTVRQVYEPLSAKNTLGGIDPEIDGSLQGVEARLKVRVRR